MTQPPSDVAPETTTYNVLFVCTGNTCRSPLAEAIARRLLEERGWGAQVQVGSAGLAARGGDPASEAAAVVAERRGIDLSGHRSRPLTPELVAWADVVLAMGPSHLSGVDALGGGHKVALLGAFAAGGERGPAVRDPFGGDVETYERTFVQLEDLVASALDRLEPIVRP